VSNRIIVAILGGAPEEKRNPLYWVVRDACRFYPTSSVFGTRFLFERKTFLAHADSSFCRDADRRQPGIERLPETAYPKVGQSPLYPPGDARPADAGVPAFRFFSGCPRPRVGILGEHDDLRDPGGRGQRAARVRPEICRSIGARTRQRLQVDH